MTFSKRRKDRCLNSIRTILSHTHKKKSPEESMASLEHHFLSPSGILESSAYMLAKEGLSEAEAQLLSLIPDLTRYTLRENFGTRPKIDRLSVASEYLKTLYIGLPVEQFNVLCLDSNGRLIQCKMLQQGSVDETPFYLSHLLQDVVFTDARAIVLSHNHPGGTRRPSKADVQSTLSAISALYSMGVPVLDHIIIADGNPVSMRGYGVVNSKLWVNQDPTSALLRNWLDIEI